MSKACWRIGVLAAALVCGHAVASEAKAQPLAGSAHDARPACSAPVGQDAFCTVNGARLHYVDWGGEGPALILIAGFGDTARAFDVLAPRLTAQRHVYALTRRGFGLSDRTPGAYSARTMGEDVVAMMDALGIDRADLVGHSAGGAEMALVAHARPERVNRLVYLDAAYDRSDALALERGDPLDRTPSPEASASLDGMVRWRAASLGLSPAAAANNVRQQFVLQGDTVASATDRTTLVAIVEGGLLAVPPDYAGIAAPSLALYAPKDRPEQPPPTSTPAQLQASTDYNLRRIRPWMLRAQADFLEQAPCRRAAEVEAGTHHFHLQRPEWTAAVILDFLADPTPCAAVAP